MASHELVRDGVRRHYERFWPDRHHEEFVWKLGPIEDRLPGFTVRLISPSSPSEPWIYVTVGASLAGERDGLEFVLLAASESARHVETLAMVASFHADPRHRLSVGSTIAIGRPWAEGAKADHLLVSLPYPFGPDLEHCDVSGRHVQVRWLVPITEAEARYVNQVGFGAFEALLEASEADVLSAGRASLVE